MFCHKSFDENPFQVISHDKFGRHVFVATILTNASPESDVVENIMEEMSFDSMV